MLWRERLDERLLGTWDLDQCAPLAVTPWKTLARRVPFSLKASLTTSQAYIWTSRRPHPLNGCTDNGFGAVNIGYNPPCWEGYALPRVRRFLEVVPASLSTLAQPLPHGDVVVANDCDIVVI